MKSLRRTSSRLPLPKILSCSLPLPQPLMTVSSWLPGHRHLDDCATRLTKTCFSRITLGHNPKLHSESEFLLRPQANDQVAGALFRTRVKAGPFHDDRVIYFRGNPVATDEEKEKIQRKRSPAPASTAHVSFSDLGDQVLLRKLDAVESFFDEKGTPARQKMS
eukprot:Plantae.Rhodophyta-Palmaria_palmata.ctg18719.p1 GENE.Plantae.Rhodophyta-Palmaria_palmata.ctg18719~~Plantae.Rhodophyta-Palmaria_palmata.ctg18719.p1  ORF type:complete len:163 (+),score=3.69 Plantae.Rhodophyta-Palmaria_palmata.ctg18719:113-601(+)